MSALVLLLSLFLFTGAVLMAAAAVWRAYRAFDVESRWTEAPARIEKCSLNEYHPFARDGGGTTVSLHCRLGFAFGARQAEYDLRTRSDRSLQTRADIRNWIVNNPPGTTLAVRVNPSDPNDLVVETELPVRQFGTPREAWLTALAFGGAGALLFMAGRKLARSGR